MNRNEQALLEHALMYAERGWKVFPCIHHGKNAKAPATLNGFHDATDDTEQIKKWWNENPKAFIGIRTGPESGIWVVDVDIKNDKNGMEELVSHFGDAFDIDIKTNLIQKTISGGFHFVFQWCENDAVTNKANVLPGIDIRGDGGYIVGAPSGLMVDEQWSVYQWCEDGVQPKKAPDWAYQLTQMQSTNRTIRSQLDIDKCFEGLSEGQRDNDIYSLVRLLKWRGISEQTANVIVCTVAERCFPPFPEIDALAKVRAVYSKETTSRTGEDDFLKVIKNKRRLKNEASI